MKRSFLRSVLDELLRLNSGRVGRGALKRLSRRDRAKAVKAALTAHHQNPSRCC